MTFNDGKEFDYRPYINTIDLSVEGGNRARTLDEMKASFAEQIRELNDFVTYLKAQKFKKDASWVEAIKISKLNILADHLTRIKEHVEEQIKKDLDNSNQPLLNPEPCLSYAKGVAVLIESMKLVKQSTSIKSVEDTNGNIGYMPWTYDMSDQLNETATNYQALTNDMEGANNGWRLVGKAMMAFGAFLATVGVGTTILGGLSFAGSLGFSTPASIVTTVAGGVMTVVGSALTFFGYKKNKRSGLSAEMDALAQAAKETKSKFPLGMHQSY